MRAQFLRLNSKFSGSFARQKNRVYTNCNRNSLFFWFFGCVVALIVSSNPFLLSTASTGARRKRLQMNVLNVSIIWAACRHHHQAPDHQHGHQQGSQQVKAPGHQQHGRHVNGPIKCRVLSAPEPSTASRRSTSSRGKNVCSLRSLL